MAFKNKGVAFIVGAVAGTVVGGVTALLLAPKSGKELRGDIKAGTEKAIEAGSEAFDHVSETVYEVSKKLEDRTVKAVQSAKQGVQQAVSYVTRNKANGETGQETEVGEISQSNELAVVGETEADANKQSEEANVTTEQKAKAPEDQQEQSDQQRDESAAIVQ